MITAKQISDWAGTGIAQDQLPRLVRRLIHGTATTTQITMPAGDSTSLPGLDGELFSEIGNAWVPKGHSCWEASCRAGITAKANEDFQKRVAETADADRKSRTYVAVTARKWSQKAKWQAERRAEKLWLDARAYDADDLEQWLEQSPAVALAFAEELGLHGPGVSSVAAYFLSWSTQCAPSIAATALLAGRDRQRQHVIGTCQGANGKAGALPIAVQADSVEEAVAFVSASILAESGLVERSVVVTDISGWRFVEKNTEIRVAVASRPEIAETPPSREGLVLIIPYASGDMGKQFAGVASRLDASETTLDRADHEEFEKVLREIGIDENNSRRLSMQCGRSWSIFRRHHAVNPAIRRPSWLDHPSAPALATLCLIGSWSSSSEVDKEVIGRIAGRPYEDLERDLRALERLDDSPVLHIGLVWKAKSALELLSLFGDRITDAEIDRFFDEAQSILSAPDPQLELDKDKRYAAGIYGKTRPISGLLLDAIFDTLIKFAVRGAEIEGLASKHIGARIDALVKELLHGADTTRWLSLASNLPALAEASPEVFLAAVEKSMGSAGASVECLFTETDNSSFMGGRCWHSGLLWALETLAWAPQHLTRVSLILARLSHIEIEGNWSNSPANSLVDLFRSWFPQTGATLEQRIKVLDVLISREPKAAARLLNSLTNTRHDMATHTARPKWRDDDAGAGYGVTVQERHQMLVAAADRQLMLAGQSAKQIAELIEKYDDFDDGRRQIILGHIKGVETADDEDREIVRIALRHQIHWHRNHGNQAEVDSLLQPLEDAYERLAPADLVIRHAWLFGNGWLDLPVKEGNFEQKEAAAKKVRIAALIELFANGGWESLVQLAARCQGGWWVGGLVLDAGVSLDEAIRWIVEQAGELERGQEETSTAAGILNSAIHRSGHEIILCILKAADQVGRDQNWKLRLLTFAPETRATWEVVETLEANDQEIYWRTCKGNIWEHDNPDHMQYALGKLLEVDRPITALNACHIKFAGIDPEMVVKMLEGLLRGTEANASLPQSYHIREAIDHVEKSGEIDRMRLAQLEFGLIKALGFQGEDHAVSLYTVLMSQPELFIELLCLVYKPRNGKAEKGDEGRRVAAENAWTIFHACARQPGTLIDGTVTEDATFSFVTKARQIAQEKDRLEMCDYQLGEIIARGPSGPDGIFPAEPFRSIVEYVGTDDLLQGVSIGCFNKRGIHSRGMLDGGEQERDLAAQYRVNSQALQFSHPKLAATLEQLAKSYERDGAMEDSRARLRREGH